MRKLKIISGGQTGIDQGALDGLVSFSRNLITEGYDHYLDGADPLQIYGMLGIGGTAPKNYMTETGPAFFLQTEYKLKESYSSYYPVRTERNVIDGDGTLVFQFKESRGCRLTINLCKKHKKPYLVSPESIDEIYNWIKENNIEVLNVAGHRQSAFDKRDMHYHAKINIMKLLGYMYFGSSFMKRSEFQGASSLPYKKEPDNGKTTADDEVDKH